MRVLRGLFVPAQTDEGEIFVKIYTKIFNGVWEFKVFTLECKAKFWDFRGHLSTCIYNQLGLIRI